jgi:enolase-phosphatase E1
MSEPIRAILLDIEGAALPAEFFADALAAAAREGVGAYITAHAEDAEIEDALEETGRLLGGFDLKLPEAEALLLRWMKQGRKATPLKTIQGLIWQERLAAGALSAPLYPDVAAGLKAWADAGLRLFGYSSNSVLAQKLLLSQSGAEDVTPLFEDFFDTAMGQKIEPASYRELAERLALAPAAILVIADNEDELDAARDAGLATVRILRDAGAASGHPTAADFASVSIGA